MIVSTGAALAAGVLATYRVTELVQSEAGPFNLLFKLRELTSRWKVGADLLNCFWCLSVWIGGAVALALALGLRWPWWLWVVATLALSGGAVAIHSAVDALRCLEDFLRDCIDRKEGF